MSFGETIGVIRPTTETDRYENTVRIYGDEPTHTIDGVAFAPGGSSEVQDGRSAVVTQPTLYLPPSSDLLAHDQVIVRGLRYEVEGSPDEWVDPFDGGGAQGSVAPLKRVAG